MACRMLCNGCHPFFLELCLMLQQQRADQNPLSCRLKCMSMPVCHAKYVIDCFA